MFKPLGLFLNGLSCTKANSIHMSDVSQSYLLTTSYDIFFYDKDQV
jgi:hypothetical protein